MTLDTTQYSRGVTSEDTPGVMLTDGQEKLRESSQLAFGSAAIALKGLAP